MKKILFFLGLCCSSIYSQQIITSKANPLIDIIEVPQGFLLSNVLNDLPGTIVTLVPDNKGNFTPHLMARKVLKNASRPELKTEPKVLIENIASQTLALSASYLSFVSGSMEKTDEVQYRVTETSNCSVNDGDIDWVNFKKRVDEIKKANPNLPANTKFGVIRVADVITIDYQVFRNVKNAGKIEGWGFSGESKFLSQKSNKSMNWIVGCALIYPDNLTINISSTISATRYTELKKEGGDNKNLNFVDFVPVIPDLIIDKALEINNVLKE